MKEILVVQVDTDIFHVKIDKGFKIVHFGEEPVIVVRVSDTEYRAFSATCTHLDCIVEYRRERQAIWCNCHNGQYDLTGRNVAGPPPRPLEEYAVNIVADEILVSRMA